MSIAKILVPLTGEKRDRISLRTAIAVARPFNAQVTALFVHLDPKVAYPYAAIPMSPVTIEDVVKDAETVSAQAEKRARALTAEIAKNEGVELTNAAKRTGRVSCSFKAVLGLFRDSVLKEAELSDLIVFGPVDTDDGPEVSAAFLDALTRMDQPVLIAPSAPHKFAPKVAIGWDGSSVAAHAVRSGLSFLKRAESVDVLTVGPEISDASVGSLKDYLALHGIAATHHKVDRGGHSVGEALLRAAQLNGADLLVVGGYGHGYWRETFFGGATAHIRWHATMPVLLVH